MRVKKISCANGASSRQINRDASGGIGAAFKRRVGVICRFEILGVLCDVSACAAVRSVCHADNYRQVYFDGNRMIREALAQAGFPSPMPAQLVLTRSA